MNKILCIIICIMICVYLVACGTATLVPPSEEPPVSSTSMPEVESIIEPVETPETSPAAIEEPRDESPAREPEPERKPAPKPPEQSNTEPVRQPQSAVKAEDAQKPAETSEPEISNTQLDSEKIELELLRLVNAEREAVGAETLGIEENMQFAARIRSEEALTSFSHTRPNGMPYNTAFDEAGFSYAGKWHGENIAALHFTPGMFDEKSAAEEIFKGLKNSQGHYRNMISKNFLQSGVGVTVKYHGDVVYITSAQLFSSI